MSTTQVPHISKRAKWAQQKTQFDTSEAPTSVHAEDKREPWHVTIVVEVRNSHDVDSVIRAISNREGTRVVEVKE
jgi:hypothetical protein